MELIGDALMDDGSVADNVRLLRGTSGAFESDSAPGADGAFSIAVPDVGPWYVVITRPGRVPLAHGPVNAVDVPAVP